MTSHSQVTKQVQKNSFISDVLQLDLKKTISHVFVYGRVALTESLTIFPKSL